MVRVCEIASFSTLASSRDLPVVRISDEKSIRHDFRADQGLAQTVMQFPGESSALLVLRADELQAQLAQLILRAAAFQKFTIQQAVVNPEHQRSQQKRDRQDAQGGVEQKLRKLASLLQ